MGVTEKYNPLSSFRKNPQGRSWLYARREPTIFLRVLGVRW
jgi:hypothetical protein